MILTKFVDNIINNNNLLLLYYFFIFLLSCSSIILSLMYFLIKKNKESLLYMISIFSYTIALLAAFVDFFISNIMSNNSYISIIINILIRTFFICIAVFTLPSFSSYYLTGMQRRTDRIILLLISSIAFFIEVIIIIYFNKDNVVKNLKTYYYNVIGIVIIISYIYMFFMILKNRNKIDTENKKFLIKGAAWYIAFCIPVMAIQYLRLLFKTPYHIYFEPFLFFFWNVYFFIYFIKFYYLHTGEKTLSINEFCKKFNISEKEKQIIEYIAKGFLNKEIGTELDIAETTVKKHIYNIFKKSNTSSRVDLVNLIKK